jgi:hypothetical protein
MAESQNGFNFVGIGRLDEIKELISRQDKSVYGRRAMVAFEGGMGEVQIEPDQAAGLRPLVGKRISIEGIIRWSGKYTNVVCRNFKALA